MKGVIMKFFVTICFTILLCIGSVFAQWEYWEANELPTASADTAWHYEQEADGGTITYSTIIDDPDIEGNKLLQFSEPDGANRETFANNWDANPSIGATLVFRMKALEVGTYNRDWDIYLYNGVCRERLVSNSGTEVKFDKSKAAITFDTSDWHIYRLTIVEDQIELFIDEDPLSYVLTTGEASEGNLFRFGDLGSSSIGTLYDWIAWNVSGPYPPGEGDPLPSELTGLPAAVRQISSVMPEQFELSQNFPNPFNPVTEITFQVQKASNIEINVYNLNGQLICNLVNEVKNIGTHSVKWNGTDNNGKAVPSGVYIYTMKADNYSTSKKMTLIR
jgi:hypothetical protein